eukprot:TRINITY_DN7090_c0_g1_i2.p1 TRINITY_DN7090_c0_g1~~TRINITY_DN7090_c0_g1_i2.p1  ORF type:complete len:190 (+),score=44.64 TRINITY_DN7090_c0_g1_i2:80-649(+)
MGSYTSNIFGGSSPTRRVLVAGLDASGKTTLLYRMKLGEIVATIPTIGFNVEDVPLKSGRALTIWDVGLRDKTRPLLYHYLKGADGFVFVVDVSDKDRYEEAAEFMHEIVGKMAPTIPLLILLNKCDLAQPDLTILDAHFHFGDMKRPVSVVPTSAKEDIASTYKGLDWLEKTIRSQDTAGKEAKRTSK